MDATKLIEEAGRVAAQAAKQSALESNYPPCTCSAPPRGHTAQQHDYRRLQVDELRAVLSVVNRLTAALKASEERARKAEQDRDALAAANVAANKRIVELEQERDAALLAAQGARRTAFNAEQKARALDAVQRDTIARLEAQVKELRAELARLTTPRPIVEAPRDGTNILGVWLTSSAPEVMHWDGSYWTDEGEELVYKPTHYLPLPEVKP